MKTYLIPVLSENQRFSVQLNGVEYDCLLVWNDQATCWCLDISSHSTKTMLIGSIPLVPETDLLEQFAYLDFGGQLILKTDDPDSAPPGFSSLGVGNSFTFVVP